MDLSKSMLGIFAHPDDETFLLGGLFALAHANGAPTYLLCLTRGEGGGGHLKEAMSEGDLGRTRINELKEAANILGISEVFVRDYPDGGLDGVAEGKILEEVVAVIKATRPYRVVTFGPEGGTGHRDHITLCGIVGKAFDALNGSRDCPKELIWRAFLESTRKMYLNPPSGRARLEGYYSKEDIVASYGDSDIEFLDITSVLGTKKKASLAHKTQDPEWFFRQSPQLIKETWESESYYRAFM